MAATADLIYSKLRARYPTGERADVASLMRRYRSDNGLEKWEKYVDHVSPSALYVPASQDTSYFSTPDHPSFAITDIDVRVLATPDSWPAVFISNQYVGQFGTPGQTGWVASIHANGAQRLAVYPSGSDPGIGPESTAAMPYGVKTTHWFRQTFVGATQVFNYYTGEDGTNWTQLGSADLDEGAGSSSPFNGNLPMEVPAGLWWGGYIHYVEVRSSVGGAIIANPDFRIQAPGTTSFNDSTGKTWTRTGTLAQITHAPGNVRDHELAFWTAFVP